jgi:hypothetical protein
MNERIKQLAEQAGMTNDKFGMFFANDKHDEDGVDLEKFAELLVRECITAVEGYYGDARQPIFQAPLKIKTHFGVQHEWKT